MEKFQNTEFTLCGISEEKHVVSTAFEMDTHIKYIVAITTKCFQDLALSSRWDVYFWKYAAETPESIKFQVICTVCLFVHLDQQHPDIGSALGLWCLLFWQREKLAQKITMPSNHFALPITTCTTTRKRHSYFPQCFFMYLSRTLPRTAPPLRTGTSGYSQVHWSPVSGVAYRETGLLGAHWDVTGYGCYTVKYRLITAQRGVWPGRQGAGGENVSTFGCCN